MSERSKAQSSPFLTYKILLLDVTDSLTSSRDEISRISSANQTSPLVETSNLSNLNNVSENDFEHRNQDEIFNSFNVSSKDGGGLEHKSALFENHFRKPLQC